MSTLALGPTQSPIQHVPWKLRGYKLAECHRKADTLPSMNDTCKQNIRDKIQKRK